MIISLFKNVMKICEVHNQKGQLSDQFPNSWFLLSFS